MIWKFLRPILFRFDAETVHGLSVTILRGVGRFFPGLLRWISGTSGAANRPVEHWGMTFLNPVGLAAGFDKNAELLPYLPHLGFGFAEIGTVTPRPQEGNPRPRLFRDSSQQAVFNRMGFNGHGAARVSARLREIKPRLPPGFRVGVNLGKNKDTPLERAAEDYAEAAMRFEGLADYLVVNVSSPNTPGLRSLQTVESLRPILRAVFTVISAWSVRPPVLVKLAPELDESDLRELVGALEPEGVKGWIVTNTLGGTWSDGIAGGWSGLPVQSAARVALSNLRGLSPLPIISVGGILSGEEARQRFKGGANLVQIYSGWVLQGPRLLKQIAESL